MMFRSLPALLVPATVALCYMSSCVSSAAAAGAAATSNTIISTADSRLPMSLTTVITDLEAEGCTDNLTTACLIFSKSVTKTKRIQVLQSLFGIKGNEDSDDDNNNMDKWKAIGTSGGIALAQPLLPIEIATSASVCGGTIIYYADPIDLNRGEGLFDHLAPAIEKIITSSSSSLTNNNNNDDDGTNDNVSQLYIIGDEETIKGPLEQSASIFLSNLVSTNSKKKVTSLQDVFDKIIYVSAEQALQVIAKDTPNKTTPENVASLVAATTSGGGGGSNMASISSSTLSSELSAADLAAARIVGPATRVQIQKILDQVKSACYDYDNNIQYVSTFGDLCTAAISVALQEIDDTMSTMLTQSSNAGKQIKNSFLTEIDTQLHQLFEEQLNILQETEFDEFKKRLSKLLISPNLAADMYQQVNLSVSSFTSAAKKLLVKKYFSDNWNINSAKHAYQLKLTEYVKNRLMNAKASGQYRPLPRKGVTIGLHWLLPKPFGNDYRQEPWMVHATDNLVYIPRDKKLSDVAPEEVVSGDWRTKIVPSPAGNDMLYMQ